jgi:hypothetical protein
MIPPLPSSALSRACGLAALVLLGAHLPARAAEPFAVSPATVRLEGNFSRVQLVVRAVDGQGVPSERSADLTGKATFHSARPDIVTVSDSGQLLAVGNGSTAITVAVSGAEKAVPVHVSGVVAKPVVGFSEDVVPILSRAGCNAGACHAAQYGQGGFKLSVFASEPLADHAAIVRASLGRRIAPLDPGRSLLLQKATAATVHGGGKRIDGPEEGRSLSPRSADFHVLAAWIAGGAPGPLPGAPTVTDLEVLPALRVGPVGTTQQLRVTAHYSNGKSRDVTGWAKFDSTDEGVVRVSPAGQVETIGRGLGAAMIRFEGHAILSRFVVPFSDKVDLTGWADHNFIDRLARARFQSIGIAPSPLCDDATFVRRAYLDAIGTLPTPEQASAFVASREPDKRVKLVDRLLGLTGDPAQDVHVNEYSSYWALKWSDLLRSNSQVLGEQGMWAMYNWLKGSFRENKPMDRMVRELITARGNPYDNGPANYYIAFRGAEAVAESTAQVLLGMRVMCAKCHHHPFERISRNDFRGLAGFFAQVSSKPSTNYGKLGGPSVILVRSDEVPQKLPKEILGMPVPAEMKVGKSDRRETLADWLTAPQNKALARNIVNRYVAYLLGRGLVEPIDDLRATNPPSNPELLDALADSFIESKFEVRRLMRTIMTSRLYQLSAAPTASNAGDRVFYSHYFVKRIAAEPLLDAIDAVTGVPTRFTKLPLGTRAIDLPDSRYDNYLLTVFGKPLREGVCECERASDPNLAQALHTLNSETIMAKVSSPQGRVAKLLAAKKSDAEVLDDLYLTALARKPSAAEQATLAKLRAQSPNRRTFYEDLMWSLLNSKNFLFVR